MEGRAFKFTEWTKTLRDKVKLKILPKIFRSKKNEKDNGTPYVINNRDGHHQQGPNISNGQWGPGPSENDCPAVVSSQNEPGEQSTGQASKSTIVSPIPSPYPNIDQSIQGSGNGEDETPPEDSVVESDRTQPGHYGPAKPSNDYSGVKGGPPHILSQSSSMPYLNKPGVMLTPAEASSDFHNIPDRIHQQQDTSGKKSSDPSVFKCHSCRKDFKQNSGGKPYGCGYCGKAFRKKAILKKHIRIHQGVMHDVFGQADKSLPDAIQHGRSAGMPLYVRCPATSNKKFKQKSTLRQHGCVHIESRPYPCVECGKRFRQQSHLTQHLRIHSNEKPFKCNYCGRNFRQLTILNQHLRIHTGEKPYNCLQCGKYFRQKTILDQHTRTHQD